MRNELLCLKNYAIAAGVAIILACGGTSPTSNTNGSQTDQKIPTGMGQLAIAMVDAPNEAVDEIWVNVTRVTAHSPKTGWVNVSTTPVKVDLLKLQSESIALGFANLPETQITQIRLYVSQDGNYVVVGGKELALKVPSGSQSGIKIKGPWNITKCSRTSVTIDFDGKASVHSTGNGQWIMRPVIRVRDSGNAMASCESGGEQTPPGPQGAGSQCSNPTDCLSGVCEQGTCSPGGPGVPCHANTDCSSATCQSDGTCASGEAGGSQAQCDTNIQCLSNSCVEHVCQPGGQGSPCNIATDCSSGLCVQQFCESQIN